jgi:S-DNA-T family DNA segregation ATPase FtsK/SpoIIIE
VGEEIQREVRDVLADAHAVFNGSRTLPWQILAGRMLEAAPEHYADLTGDTISTQLRALGVPSVNVKWDGSVLKGAKADDIQAARAKRDGTTGSNAA